MTCMVTKAEEVIVWLTTVNSVIILMITTELVGSMKGMHKLVGKVLTVNLTSKVNAETNKNDNILITQRFFNVKDILLNLQLTG